MSGGLTMLRVYGLAEKWHCVQFHSGREVELSMDIRSDDKHPFFLGGMALTPDSDTTRHNVHRVQGPATVVVEGLRDDRTLIRTDNTTSLFSLLSFMYAVDDVESLKEHTEGREQRRALWLREQARERLALNKELEELNDFLLVQGVDVYRSLPSKVLQCHKWFADNFEARHILKTDDDTFVNVKGIVDRLSTRPLQGHEWWANFRHGSVHRAGKWREPDYSPAVYPNFPCGSGYVVSRDLHLWLVANKDVLHSFQGEDVSMGIWLTPLAPTLIHDTRWQCYKICQDDMLSMPDLTPEEVTLRWQQYTKCSSPCTAC